MGKFVSFNFAMATELTFRGCIFLIRIARGRWMKGIVG
jgi:hypothetical protein